MSIERPMLLYSELRVRDIGRSERFFTALGLRRLLRGSLTDGTVLLWLLDPRSGQLLQLFQLSRRSKLYRPFASRKDQDFQLMFSVERAEPRLARLRSLGGRVVEQLREGPVVLTTLLDPDGTRLELLSWSGPPTAGAAGPPQAALLDMLVRRALRRRDTAPRSAGRRIGRVRPRPPTRPSFAASGAQGARRGPRSSLRSGDGRGGRSSLRSRRTR